MKTAIVLQEWERAEPEQGSPLHSLYLPDDRKTRQQTEMLSRQGMLILTEKRYGLAVEATSFVGQITLGELTITIQPKVSGVPLMRLLRYTYGLRDLAWFGGRTNYTVDSGTPFHDLIIHQLAAEVGELLAHALRREYVRAEDRLSSPRGRIDLQRVARDTTTGRRETQATATLPCIHYQQQSDTELNQTLLRGLHHAARVTDDPEMRAILLRLRARLESSGVHAPDSRPPLTIALRQASASLNRLTSPYRPALTLLELLCASEDGPGLNTETRPSLLLPGFLFDMNRFFQALLQRFLTENLPARYRVRADSALRGVFAYAAEHNPRSRRAPTPRPDYAILHGDRPVALLDAKYRDLWEQPLPREMLYQLAVYAALGARAAGSDVALATILYPTMAPEAREQRIDILPPTSTGQAVASVVLRPVNLGDLAELVGATGTVEARGGAAALGMVGIRPEPPTHASGVQPPSSPFPRFGGMGIGG